MVDLDTQFLPDETAGPLTTEEVLGADRLGDVGVDAFQLHLDRVGRIGAIILEVDDGPGTLDSGAGLLDLVQKDALNLALVYQGREGVPRIDEARAARPASRAMDPLFPREGVPKGDIVHLGGVVGHNLTLQAQVAQDFRRPRLDPIGATRGRRHRTVIDMLHLVPPS